MQAVFYNFNKRKNSTARPTDSGTTIDVVLKEGSDFDNPVFHMQTDVTGYTYMKWNDHYYFITGRRYLYANYYEISCEIDVLGSYRGSIKASTQYILRTSVETLADYSLIDNSYPTGAEPDYWSTGITIGINDTGCYVLSVKSEDGVQYFLISRSQLETLLDQIMAQKQEDLWSTISDLVATLGPSFLNASDYIIGCRWMPFPIPGGGGASNPIVLGYWPTGITAKEASTQFDFVSGTDISLTVHPESDAKKAFTNCSQYHACTVFVPGCGETVIDFAKVQGSTIKVDITVDIAGCVTAIIKNSVGEVLGRAHGILGCEVPITASNVGAGGIGAIAAGAGTVVASIATAGAAGFGAALGEAAAGAMEIGTGVAASIPDVNTSGGAGSYLVPDGAKLLRVQEWVYPITAQAASIQGYPSMKVATLSSNGYYQIKNPQVAFGDDTYIKDMIKAFMQSGFYIE